MKKITEILKQKEFTFSVELVPPRNGSSPDEIFNQIERLKDDVDFVSVTKGAGGSLRGGSLPITYFCQEKYNLNTIAHFVCRERTKQEIENELMDLYYFKIKNVLALRGDPPAGTCEEWDGDCKYAYKLVKLIKNLNNGEYFGVGDEKSREGFKTDFCILVAGHPEDPIEEEIEHLKIKMQEGAEVIITQMVFSFDKYKNYVEALRKAGIKLPVIPGIRPVTSYKQAVSVEKFFNVPVNDELKNGLKKNGKDFGLKYFSDMIKELKEYKAPGVHLFILNDTDTGIELIKSV